MLSGLWRYRSFIVDSVRRDFRARYLNSWLGGFWAIIQPLFMIAIYTIIFGRLLRVQLPSRADSLAYVVFLCAGVMTWGLFTEVITRCLQMFIEHASLLKKARFPRTALPAIVLLTATLNFGIVFTVLVLFLLTCGRFPGWPLLAFAPLILVQQTLALGVGLALGTANVFLRDVGHAATLLLTVWFWLTPIVYPLQILSEEGRTLLRLNPLTGLVAAYQQVLLTGSWPDWRNLVPALAAATVALTLGLVTFRRFEAEMIDHL
jgi:lipopolysaccharide transport system permease protein